MSGGGILVFARLDSSRLPGKVLRDLAGRPLLGRVLDRLRRVKRAPMMVVATSDRAVDDPVQAFAAGEGVPVFRGSVSDVGGRAVAAARRHRLDWFVRISADSPFIAPEVVEGVAALFQQEQPDLATNVHPRTFPPGISVEAVDTDRLDRTLAATDDAEDHEHVTRAFYRQPERFRIVNFAARQSYAGIHLAVDTQVDFDRAAWISTQLDDCAAASLNEVVRLARDFDARLNPAQATAGRAVS